MIKRIAQRGTPVITVLVILFFSLKATHTVHSTSRDSQIGQSNTDASLLFAKNCATCHGKDGRAKTFKAKFNHARNLTDASWQASVTDERLFNSIKDGRGHMPAWGKKFSDAEINALVIFVRQLKK